MYRYGAKITTNKGYVDKKLSFIRLISKQIAELHISGNNGAKDERREIQANDLSLIKQIADTNKSHLDLIIETKNITQAQTTKNLLLS